MKNWDEELGEELGHPLLQPEQKLGHSLLQPEVSKK